MCYAKNFLLANDKNTQITTFVDVINKFVIYFESDINVNFFKLIIENFDKLIKNVFLFFKDATTINFRLLTNDFRRRRLINNCFFELRKLFQL